VTVVLIVSDGPADGDPINISIPPVLPSVIVDVNPRAPIERVVVDVNVGGVADGVYTVTMAGVVPEAATVTVEAD